ncbi:putative S-transferase [Hyaloraphidium curvatum]|nr:putative S-transferase [Hyaloraphidium curvatum]
MSEPEKKEWKPPAKIEELYAATSGNQFASINAPTAGAREQVDNPAGSAPLQLYSLATPNGAKVGIMLEELGVDYDAFVVNIGKGEQFYSGFVSVNPNSKIPALQDRAPEDGGPPINLFESGSIVLYLADKYDKEGKFMPKDARGRAEVINWAMWQMAGQGPMTGNFGHFMVYAPADKCEARDYGVARYGMEVQRLCSVLENTFKDGRKFLLGDKYTVADIMVAPWFNALHLGYKHPSGVDAKSFLSVDQYKLTNAWRDRCLERPAVQRGLQVCRGTGKPWLEKKDDQKL